MKCFGYVKIFLSTFWETFLLLETSYMHLRINDLQENFQH
jgi:hypothetical protein